MGPRIRSALTLPRERSGRVRVRLTAVVAVLTAVALAAAAAIVLVLLRSSLTDSADATMRARAHTVTAALGAEQVSGIDPDMLAASGGIDVVQVIGPDGRLLAGTHGVRGAAATSPVAPGDTRVVGSMKFTGDPAEYRAIVTGVRTGSGTVLVVVATGRRHIDEVVGTVGLLLAVVFPAILLLSTVGAYAVSGRTLAPVARIRRQVEEVSATDLTEPITVPRTRDEISDLAQTMNRMLARLGAARAEQLRFVGDASHELRSPLMTIVGLLDLAHTTGRPIDEATVDDLLLPEALRLQRLVDDLLLLAKADERGVPLRVTDVDLDDTVLDETDRLQRLHSLRVDVHVVGLRAVGDPDKLGRALRNVLDNAARHARSRIVVTMRHDRAAGEGSVTVGDDGPGIAAADRDRVLERFVRLDTDRRRTAGGSGLGLAIVAEIVSAHGGRVHIGRSDLGGAEVTITLPSAVDD